MKKRRVVDAMKSKFARSVTLPLVALFLVLVGVIALSVFSSFINELETKIVQAKMNQLEEVENSISNQMKNVQNVAYQVGRNHVFLLTPSENRNFSGTEMVNGLKNFIVSNDFIEYLAYYRYSEPYKIYSSAGEMSFSSFYSSCIRIKEYTETGFLEKAADNDGNTVIIKGVGTEIDTPCFFMIEPLPIFSLKPQAWALAVVEESSITNIIKYIFNDCSGRMFILDESGNLLLNYGVADITENQAIKRNSDGEISEDKEIRINGTDYLVLTKNASYGKWKYICLLKKNDMLSDLTRKQISFIVFVVSLALITCALIMLIVLVRYAPVNRLAEAVKNEVGVRSESERDDEQQLLHTAFNEMLYEKKNAYNTIFYVNLLENQYDEDTVEFYKEEYGIETEGSVFRVIAVALKERHYHRDEKKKINSEIRAFFDSEDIRSTVIYRAKPRRFIVILNMDKEQDDNDRLLEEAEWLAELLNKKFGLEKHIGIGKSYERFLSVSDSAKEATNAMAYSVFEQTENVVRFEDVELEQGELFEKIAENLVSVQTALKRGDREKTENAIEKLENVCETYNFSKINKNYIAFSIISSMYEYAESKQISKGLDEGVKALLGGSEKADAIEIMKNACMEYLRENGDAKGKPKDQLLKQIKQVIQEHLFDSMLSLEMIASECDISSSYLSRYFKANVGCTPMGYIEVMRMDVVKDKLINSDESLKQILEETGYIDQSNFIRKFKKSEGITPMVYRKLHKEQEEKAES